MALTGASAASADETEAVTLAAGKETSKASADRDKASVALAAECETNLKSIRQTREIYFQNVEVRYWHETCCYEWHSNKLASIVD